jgi:sulfide:quinone oxidoreductase
MRAASDSLTLDIMVTARTRPDQKFRVVIAGGGLAALEGALALTHVASDLTDVVVIAPNTEFPGRHMIVREPFGYPAARQYPVAEIVHAAGAELLSGELAWIDPRRQTVHTGDDQSLHYDALLLALGARMVPRYKHALTIDDRRFDESFYGLIQDIEEGYTSRIAFVSPARVEAPVALYELALMAAARAYDMDVAPSISIVTPEDAPLGIFGSAVSTGVSDLLAAARIQTITSARVEIPDNGRLVIQPGERRLRADRVVALPELYGPSLRGVPLAEYGFVRVDRHQRVPDVGPVYAAGDLTQLAIKHEGVASQQADAASESIAALAGAPVTPKPFDPMIRGILLTGDKPLYFSADVSWGDGFNSDASDSPMWSPVGTIAAKYLSPALGSLVRSRAHLETKAVRGPGAGEDSLPRTWRRRAGQRAMSSLHLSTSESSPPRERRRGGEHGGGGVEEQGSRGSHVGSAQPHRERREACGCAGGEQADPVGRLTLKGRA